MFCSNLISLAWQALIYSLREKLITTTESFFLFDGFHFDSRTPCETRQSFQIHSLVAVGRAFGGLLSP